MSWTLIKASLRQRRWALLWYSLGLVVYSYFIVWFWPQMQKMDYDAILDQMPPELLAMFGDATQGIDTFGGFAQTEFLGIMWIFICGAAVIMYASKALAGDVDSQTMEVVLAQPVSRAKVVFSRAVGLKVFAAVLSLATFLPMQILGPSHEIDLPLKTYLLLYLFAFLFLLAIGFATYAISAIVRDAGRAGGIAAGILGVMWFGDFLSTVSDFAEKAKPINLISYWKPGQLINEGFLHTNAWWVYLGVAIVGFVVALIAFSRRDAA